MKIVSSMSPKIQVFLSYASEDRGAVEALYGQLQEEGLSPWMDSKDILPGEQWEQRIWKAIHDSDFFCVILSNNSIHKRGFLQKEIKKALDLWEEKLSDDIYLIPIRLEPCDPPDELKRFHWIDYGEEAWPTRLLKSIEEGVERRNLRYEYHPISDAPLEIRYMQAKDVREGLPTYEAEAEYPQLSGPPGILLEDINRKLSEFALKLIADFMKGSEIQFDKDQFEGETIPVTMTLSYLEASSQAILLTDQLLSVRFSISWYGAGAAHGNQNTETLNFNLHPTKLLQLKDLFLPESDYLRLISKYCIQDLLSQGTPTPEEGASPEEKNFKSFLITANSLDFVFDPYQVDCYAAGTKEVSIPYKEMQDILDRKGPLAPLLGSES